MLLKEFYTTVFSSEAACINFLQEHLLLGDIDSHDLCKNCGNEMTEKRRKNQRGEWCPVLRCTKCQTFRSLRTGKRIFHYTDLNERMNSNLSWCHIMELMYSFIVDMPVKLESNLTGRSTATVMDWYSMNCEVCSAVIAKKSNVRGTNSNPIQIDEARFAGRLKYNTDVSWLVMKHRKRG